MHEHDCKYILQLSHGGRQRDIPTIDYPKGLSSTGKMDPLHGFECEAMTLAQIKETVQAFAEGARRAREAGLDGVELHGANGYLITQFLSSGDQRSDRRVRRRAGEPRAIRPRDRPGDPRARRARFPPADEDQRDRVQQRAAPRGEAGQHRRGLDSGVPVAEGGRRGRDPRVVGQLRSRIRRIPAGDLPIEELRKTYDSLISSGVLALRNYLLFTGKLTGDLFKQPVGGGARAEGADRRAQSRRCARDQEGGRRHSGAVHGRISDGGDHRRGDHARRLRRGDHRAGRSSRTTIWCSSSPRGIGRPANPCTYCNECLVNAPENPLGCYEESRFPSREAMVQEILSVYRPQPFQ